MLGAIIGDVNGGHLLMGEAYARLKDGQMSHN